MLIPYIGVNGERGLIKPDAFGSLLNRDRQIHSFSVNSPWGAKMNTRQNTSKQNRNSVYAAQHTKLYSAMKLLTLAGVMVSANGWFSASAGAAVDACGKPPTVQSGGAAVSLWKDCSTDAWTFSVTGGGSKTQLIYTGSITGAQAADYVVGSSIEKNDVLDNSNPEQILFALNNSYAATDEFTFAFPSGAPVCLTVTGPVTTLFVGADRTPVTSPVDLRTMGPCGYSYLEDANTNDSIETTIDSDLGERPFPRLSTGNLHLAGTAEQMSKYDIVALKPTRFDLLRQVQAINSATQGLRVFCPQEYQGATEQNSCRTGNGMPFDTTAESTGPCNVYAGHWLYAPGTTLSAAITATSVTLKVADPSRFNAGRYVVIYDGGPGAFVNAEHARVTTVNTATKTLTLESRAYKSTARAHGAGAIVAEHVLGNDAEQSPLNWAYNLSTASPRDGSGRQLNEVMAEWLAKNYDKSPTGGTVAARVDGITYDSDFHFVADGGHGRKPDVNNDLVLDNGLTASGDNLWGDGLDAFYTMVRDRLPNAIILGGVVEARGFTSLNGIQLEGWVQRNLGMSATPDYREIDGRLSAYSVQMHHGRVGPRVSEGINKMPTKLYPSTDDPNPPDNSGFRFSYGLMLLDDGYYGQMAWHVNDPWWDEYAVDVLNATTFGQAVPANATDESKIRDHDGWMGFPLGPRYRVYDPVIFAPERNLLTNGGFDSTITGWTGSNVKLSLDTTVGDVLDGTGALRISKHEKYASSESGAFVRGPTVSLVKGVQYTLVFGIRSSSIRTIQVAVGSESELLYIPDTWSRQVFTFVAESTGNPAIRFNVGRESSDLSLDSIYVFEGNADVFRRDFDNAVVVVNATPAARMVDLGGTFQRILGTGQDPINDGATVTQVTLPPYDSIVLVRP